MVHSIKSAPKPSCWVAWFNQSTLQSTKEGRRISITKTSKKMPQDAGVGGWDATGQCSFAKQDVPVLLNASEVFIAVPRV